MPTKKFPFNNKNHRNNSNSKIYSGNDINSTQSNLCNKEKYYNDNNCKLTNESNNSISLYEIGLRGPRGYTGPQGIQGEPGGILGYADFYALMPPDNSSTISINSASFLIKSNNSSFNSSFIKSVNDT